MKPILGEHCKKKFWLHSIKKFLWYFVWFRWRDVGLQIPLRGRNERPQLLRCRSRFNLDSPRIWTPVQIRIRPVQIHRRIWTPFVDLDPTPPTPTKLSLKKSFVSYLVTNSICKLFVDKDKEKQPFRSNSAAFIIASRTVYARIKCEQQNFVVEYERWIPDFSSLHGE